MVDVTVVGGGVIGLSIACELAGQGRSVRVVDRAAFGTEASWAGAGMLPPGNPRVAADAEPALRGSSHELWPEWTQFLREETGIENGFQICGGLQLRTVTELDTVEAELRTWQAEGVEVERLDVDQLLELEPDVHPDHAFGYLLPQMGQVRNPRHLKALLCCCERRGVDLRPFTEVTGCDVSGSQLRGILTTEGRFQSEAYVIASGAWSRRVAGLAGLDLRLEPMRGQIVLLNTAPGRFTRILECGKRYLVPRRDGRLLVGSTEERAGFRKENTAQGVSDLMQFAMSLVPALATASVERVWAGLRPCAEDGLPYIGFAPGFDNALIATGHFRAGLQLSPITAVLVRQLLDGESPACDLTAFRVDREPVDLQIAEANT